jgi:beta-mannosidase
VSCLVAKTRRSFTSFRSPLWPLVGRFLVLLSGWLIPLTPVKSEAEPPDHSLLVFPLITGWRFQEVGKSLWYPATVPGCIHTDLFDNHLIDDPFFGNNESKLQWIGETLWIYQDTFSVSRELLARENVDLVFEGLDTYAAVSLNGTPLLKADNMFRHWRVACRSSLRLGENTLQIKFSSPINKILPRLRNERYPLPAVRDQGEKTSPYTRKAPYQYGWDWAPRFVTSGIWKPVYLEAWDGVRISDFCVQQVRIAPGPAQLQARLELESTSKSAIQITIHEKAGGIPKVQKTVQVNPGKQLVQLDIPVPQPKLWWPNGLGPQFLYQLEAGVAVNRKLVDRSTVKIGLRTIELRQQPDAWGKGFQFVINGTPTFAKGGNWVPADSFPSRVTRDRYRYLLQSCRDAHMNMIRVWGGGIYEMDDFYDLCDEMGLLVWQDFMFSCTLYPADGEFLENVRAEAADNLKRLRNHPCLTLWCGNNEVETGWFDWGWKKKYPGQYWEDYQRLFLDLLPQACKKFDPSRSYWPSSPSSNREDQPNSEKIGDVHFWGVWHGDLAYEAYRQHFPRFLSEYGFQSFPAIDTLKNIAHRDEMSLNSPNLLAHQKNPGGNQRILEYVARYFSQPKDFESLVYLSQVLQADAIKTGAEHLRQTMPRSMGSLFWQIDDCWPAISWSSIDYFGRWKALHYAAKRFYNDVLVSFREEKGQVQVVVVSDKQESVPLDLHIRLLDFDGQSLLEMQRRVSVGPIQSQVHWRMDRQEIMEGRDARTVLLQAELRDKDAVVSENRYFFEIWNKVILPNPGITTKILPDPAGPRIQLISTRFASNVSLSLEGIAGSFTDNFFDLLPGRPVEVRFTSPNRVSPEEVSRNLRIRSLVDAFLQ